MHSLIKRNVLQHKINTKIKSGLVAFYDIRPGNGAGLFSKEKISIREEIIKEKVKKKMISGEAYDISKQTIGLYIAPKSKIESRAHFAPEPRKDIEAIKNLSRAHRFSSGTNGGGKRGGKAIPSLSGKRSLKRK